MPEITNTDKGDAGDEKREEREGGARGSLPASESFLAKNVGGNLATLTETAVGLLGVKDFIKKNPTIFEKLEQFNEQSEVARVDANMMFIALSLPVVNGIIHIASDPTSLGKAMRWVGENWEKLAEDRDPDAISILSALTLLYVASEGRRTYASDERSRKVWDKILERVKFLNEPMKDS